MQSGRAGASVTAATRRGLARRRGKLMDKAILLAVAASVCTATASLCQRKGARDNETAGFDARLLVRLARRPAWLGGIAAMIGGFTFQITALRYGDLAQVQPILAAELLFVFGYLAVAGTRRVSGRDLLAAAGMAAGIGVFLRLAAPSGGRPHAPGSSWLLAGLVTASIVVAALAVASGLGRRPGASRGRPAAVVSAWSLYLLLAAGAVTMLLAAHALAAGPLAASQPGFTILDPLAASLLGVFVFGEHIRTDAGALAGEALALAVVIAGAAALSRSSLIAGENASPARQYQAALSSAASALPATRPPADPADPPVPGSCRTRRPPALSPQAAARADRTRPGPAPAAARTGPPRPARGHQDLDPEPAAA